MTKKYGFIKILSIIALFFLAIWASHRDGYVAKILRVQNSPQEEQNLSSQVKNLGKEIDLGCNIALGYAFNLPLP